MININDVIFLYHESEESVYKYLFEKISELYFNLLKNVDINIANQSLMYMRSLVYINYSEYDIECYEIVDLLYDENYNEGKI